MLASVRVEYDFRMQARGWGKAGRKTCLGDWAWFECLWNLLFDSSVKEVKRRVLVKAKRSLCKSEDLCLCGGCASAEVLFGIENR